MTSSLRVLVAFAFMVATAALRAQTSALPTATAISAQTLVAGGEASALNLATYFKVANLTGSVVQFDTTKGKFNAQLFATDAPKTVTNFLGYVNRGDYTNSVIHRSQSNFVIQSGGYTLSGSNVSSIAAQAAVQNEYKLANVRGTIGMAKTAAGPDTATSQWFVNLADNSATLGTQNNGGFTVFAQVLGTGMTVVDAIAAVPVYDASATTLGADFSQLPLLANSLAAENFLLVKSITPISVYPDVTGAPAVLRFTASSSNSAVATATIAGSLLIVKPLSAGSTVVTVRATDTNDNFTEASFGAIVTAAPLFTTQPASQGVALGATFTLSSAATGSPTIQWQLNGSNINGATTPGINIQNFQATNPGLFAAVATIGNAVTVSNPAIVGLSVPITEKIAGLGQEVGSNIYVAANGKTYDQVLLQGAGAAVRADFSPVDADNQITRISYIDLNDDIVQVEYSGPGTLSLVLEESSGPALPVKYNQPVSYMKGHASIIITGANEYSNVSVFSVGRITAVNQALFKSDVTYDGVADIGLIAIATTNGKFGGVRTANAYYYNVKGYTGVYAPGVAFQGPVFIGNLSAFGVAKPVIVLGSASEVRITGGSLLQNDSQPVQVSGITKLKFTPGIDSHGNGLPALANKAVLLQDGNDVTAQIVESPVQ